ncbi:MAG: type II toxin-antitoxin system HipA family toxin [Solirubrobacterales bacterium]
MSSVAEVRLWGRRIGAVSLADEEATASFEYETAFARSGIEVAPLETPLGPGVFGFPELSEETFHGLPGLLADSLPDRFGNALINAWLASQGREPDSLDAVERLSYIGERGMGALEFSPAIGPGAAGSDRIDVEELADLAAEALSERTAWTAKLSGERERAIRQILRVGTSAGGARPKALIALNPATREIRSGQGDTDPGFEHWLLKFDGVDDESGDLGRSRGYGAIEYVYSQMARQAGIEMSETALLEEGGRRHFLTRRFDRLADGSKLHMQSLGALWHLDLNQPGGNSYEQAFGAIRRLRLGHEAVEQMFRRMTFNVIARNQDDHVKNIAFLMDRRGRWSLAPAFDLVYAVGAGWTARHQMSINARRESFTIADFRKVAEGASMKRGRADRIVDEVTEVVRGWPELAQDADIDPGRARPIGDMHRLDLTAR